MRRVLLIAALLGGCQRAAPVDETPGGRLEAAAVARGMVADPVNAGIAGSWASDTDRLCIIPGTGAIRLGASVDYGEGQACAAAGTVERDGGKLKVRLGDCRFEAQFEGDRIVFPAELPSSCDRFCAGRASLAALTVQRLSESTSEAATVRGPNGKLLCAAD